MRVGERLARGGGSVGELAVANGVPQLDGLVSAARHDLTVVGAERDGQNIRGVAYEGAGGVASGQVPQAQRTVPGARQSELAVGGNNDILREGEAAGGRAERGDRPAQSCCGHA